MARILAIELSATEARGALLDGGRLAQSFTVSRAAGNLTAVVDEVQRRIVGIKRSRTPLVVVVGGGDVQLRLLTLPTGDERELPAMVELQAEREFPSSENLVIDYVPVDSPEANSSRVLVARLGDELLADARKLAELLELPLARVVLRPLAAASLAGRLEPRLRSGTRLIAARCGQGVDLVLQQAGRPLMVRQVLGEVAGLDPAIRQTLLAARGQFADNTVESVHVLDDAESSDAGRGDSSPPIAHTALRSALDKQIAIDPQVAVASLTGVIGALLDESAKLKPAIDFLHPKQPEVDTAPAKRQRILAGAAAATVLLGGWWGWAKVRNLDTELVSANEQVAGIRESIAKFEPYVKQATEIEKWRATDVNWLDELARLSTKLRPAPLDSKEFPVEGDALVTGILASNRPATGVAGGRLEVTAAARDRSKLSTLEDRLRDEEHSLEPLSVEESPAQGEYRWSVKYVVGAPAAAVGEEETP